MTEEVSTEKTPLIDSIKGNLKGSLENAQAFGAKATETVKGSWANAHVFGVKATESVKGSLITARDLSLKATNNVKGSLSTFPENVNVMKTKATEGVKATIVHAHDFGVMATVHAQKVVNGVINGNTSIRWLAFLTATVLMLDTVISLLFHLGKFEMGAALLSFYAFTCGFAAVVMEADLSYVPLFPSANIRSFLAEHINALHTVNGRGGLYFVAGTLECMLPQNRSRVIGGITIVIAAFYIFLGSRVSYKIHAVKAMFNDMDDADIKAKFLEMDSSGDGTLNFDEFYAFLKAMGVDFDVREAEIVYIDMDKDMNDRIAYEEFGKFLAKV